MRNWKRWIASLMAALLVIQSLNAIDFSPLQVQKAYADTVMSPMQTATPTRIHTSTLTSTTASVPTPIQTSKPISATASVPTSPTTQTLSPTEPNPTDIQKTLPKAQAFAVTSRLEDSSTTDTTATPRLCQLDALTADSSVFSNQLMANAATTTSAISIPANINVTSTDTTLTISWDSVADAKSYDVSLDGNVINVTTTNYTYSSLEPNTQHTVKVRAVNQGASSEWSTEIEKYTLLDTPCNLVVTLATISIPANVNITATDTTLTVSWDAVADAQNYDVSLDEAVINVTSTSYTFSSLEPNTSHIIKVRAVNPNGSNGIIGDINGDGGVDAIDLALLKKYIFTPNESPSEEKLWVGDLNGDKSIDAIDFSLMKIYQLDNTRHFPKSVSAWSTEITKYTLLAIPINFVASPASSSVNLTWDAVAGATGYEIYRDNKEIASSVTNSYSDMGLTAGTTYEYKIKAYNAAGNVSGSSEAVTVTTKAYTISIPSNISATATTTTLIVNWNAVSGATNYDVEINGVVVQTVIQNSCEVKGLTPNTEYKIRIKAKNDNEYSEWSNEISKTTSLNTNVNGTISQNTTWTLTNSPYVLQGDVIIAPGVTLTIESGVIVKSVNREYGIDIQGKLIAVGKSDNPIVFTSYKDSAYGGSGVTDSTDYWYGINVSETGEFTGDNIKIKYGGNDSYALNVQGILNLNNSAVTDSYKNGILISSGNDTTIQNTIIDIKGGFATVYILKKSITTGIVTLKNNTMRNGSIFVNEAGSSGMIVENNTIESIRKKNEVTPVIEIEQHGTGIFIISGNNLTSNKNESMYPISVCLDEITSDVILSIILEGVKNNIINGNRVTDLMGIYGNMNVDLTFPKYQYFISNTIIISCGKTLTLQPGTIMLGYKFATIEVNGKLIAQGTTESPIVFTSYEDPEYGGSGVDEREDNWNGIQVSNTGEFVGDNIKIRYGGNLLIESKEYIKPGDNKYFEFFYCTLGVLGKLTLINSEVSNSFNYGVYFNTTNDTTIKNTKIDGSMYHGICVRNTSVTANGRMTFENNIISNNLGAGICVENFGAGELSIQNNSLPNNGIKHLCYSSPIYINLGGVKTSIFHGIQNNTYTGNGSGDGIGIGGILSEDFTLYSGEYYLITSLTIPNEKTLTVQPGVVMKSIPKNSVYYCPISIDVQGKLIARGTTDNPIVFTINKDSMYSEIGVDSSTIDEDGHWMGVQVSSTGEFVGDNVKIRYGGGYDSIGILTVLGNLTLTNSEVSNSYKYGIYFNTTLQPTLKCNNFYNNNFCSIYNSKPSQITINAQNNYWGSPNGPTTSSVSSGVDYSNWLESSCSTDQLGTLDLVVKELTAIPQNPQPDDKVVLKAVVTKVGAIALPNGVKAQFIVDDSYITDYTCSITAGEDISFTLTDNTSLLSTGKHTVKFIVDPLNEIAENDKSNNTKTLSFNEEIINLDTPTGISATATSDKITLTWPAVARAAKYIIEIDGSTLAFVSGESFEDINLLPGSSHSYRIKAKNGSNESGWSDVITKVVGNDTYFEDDDETSNGYRYDYIESIGLGIASSIIENGGDSINMTSAIFHQIFVDLGLPQSVADAIYVNFADSEENVLENINSKVKNPQGYYVGRVITDSALAASAAQGAIAGVELIIAGLTGEAASAAAEALSLGSGTPVLAISAAVSAAAVAVGAVVAVGSISLAATSGAALIDDVGKLKNANSSKSNSLKLRENMIKAGMDEPNYKPNVAHHIVPETASKAQKARDILKSCGIDDINCAENGVFLPRKEGLEGAGSASVHTGRHLDNYIVEVTSRLEKGLPANPTIADKQTAINILSKIRQDLLNGKLKLQN